MYDTPSLSGLSFLRRKWSNAFWKCLLICSVSSLASKLGNVSLIFVISWFKTWTVTCKENTRLFYKSLYKMGICLLLEALKLWVWIPLGRGVLDITLCDKVSQWLEAGRWFSPATQISSTNKTDCHDITEMLLKVALNTIILIP